VWCWRTGCGPDPAGRGGSGRPRTPVAGTMSLVRKKVRQTDACTRPAAESAWPRPGRARQSEASHANEGRTMLSRRRFLALSAAGALGAGGYGLSCGVRGARRRQEPERRLTPQAARAGGRQLHRTRTTDLPPAFVRGPDGRPWHSWRVLILPYIEQRVLFEAYVRRAVDGPSNSKARRPDAEDLRVLRHEFPATHDQLTSPSSGKRRRCGRGRRAGLADEVKDGAGSTILLVKPGTERPLDGAARPRVDDDGLPHRLAGRVSSWYEAAGGRARRRVGAAVVGGDDAGSAAGRRGRSPGRRPCRALPGRVGTIADGRDRERKP
jgi:hypothetical protein